LGRGVNFPLGGGIKLRFPKSNHPALGLALSVPNFRKGNERNPNRGSSPHSRYMEATGRSSDSAFRGFASLTELMWGHMGVAHNRGKCPFFKRDDFYCVFLK